MLLLCMDRAGITVVSNKIMYVVHHKHKIHNTNKLLNLVSVYVDHQNVLLCGLLRWSLMIVNFTYDSVTILGVMALISQ